MKLFTKATSQIQNRMRTINHKRVCAMLALLLIVIGTPALRSARAMDEISIRWFYFNPLVIRSDSPAPAQFKVKIDGNPTSAQFALATGESMSLTSEGGGVWSATLTAAQTLFGYGSDDVNTKTGFTHYLHFKARSECAGDDFLLGRRGVGGIRQNVQPAQTICL
jgi:hypothetical protein